MHFLERVLTSYVLPSYHGPLHPMITPPPFVQDLDEYLTVAAERRQSSAPALLQAPQ